LRANIDSQFDAKVVTAFLALLSNASLTYLTGARANFAIEAQKAVFGTESLFTAAA